MNEIRLSSDFLFHYKQSFDILLLILKDGFRHNLWTEGIPYKNSKQLNFMSCFCDIRPRDAGYHRQCYGNVAIALKKDWGIRNGISPVRYVHEGSHGVSSNYIALKNMFRKAETFREIDITVTIKMYLLFSMLHQRGRLFEGDIDRSIETDGSLINDLEKAEVQFDSFLKSISATKGGTDFIEFLSNMFERVADLHNELENRDSFMRAYCEDFSPAHGDLIKDKILYDEREWRSVKTVAHIPDGSHLPIYRQACSQKFLPKEYNLTFDNDDVAFIVVENIEHRDLLIDYLKVNECLIDAEASISKIVSFDDLKSIDVV